MNRQLGVIWVLGAVLLFTSYGVGCKAQPSVQVVSNPDAVPVELAVMGPGQGYGLKDLADHDRSFDAKAQVEEAQKSVDGKPIVGFRVILRLKGGSAVPGDAKLAIGSIVMPAAHVGMWTQEGSGPVPVLLANGAGGYEAGRQYVMQDAVVFIWWGIPRSATDAVLQLPDHKPISLRFKLQ